MSGVTKVARVLAVVLVVVAAGCSGNAATPAVSRPKPTVVPSLLPTSAPIPSPSPGSGNAFVHADGNRIVDGQGRPIQLRGVNVEGWLQWQGIIFGAGFTSEHVMATRLQKLVGDQAFEQFRRSIYEEFITEDDFVAMARLGFNVVRIPINHRLLTCGSAAEQPCDANWIYLDQALDWAEIHGLYVILDLHSAPGGQSALFTADPDRQALLWNSEANQDLTVSLWQTIAARYRDRTVVAGYDLLNEPAPPDAQALLSLYGRIAEAIRLVDPNHMLILEGAKLATDLSIFQYPLDTNMAYSFHTYALLSRQVKVDDVRDYGSIARRQQVPVINTEFGANTYQWIEQTIASFEDPANDISGWMFWTWKRISSHDDQRYVNLFTIPVSQSWTELATWLGSPGMLQQEPSEAEALAGMMDFLQSIKLENNRLDSQTADTLTAFLDQ